MTMGSKYVDCSVVVHAQCTCNLTNMVSCQDTGLRLIVSNLMSTEPLSIILDVHVLDKALYDSYPWSPRLEAVCDEITCHDKVKFTHEILKNYFTGINFQP